ncbi:MAG: hypothetical protein ABW346_04845, partial [Terrimicrobium sp.]
MHKRNLSNKSTGSTHAFKSYRGTRIVGLTFSRILDRGQLEFPTVRSSRFVVGFLCLSSLANAAGGKFADDGLWTLWSTLHF